MKLGSRAQIALSEKEFEELFVQIESNLLKSVDAKFILWAVNLRSALLPGFNNPERVTFGVGLIQLDIFFIDGTQQIFWIASSSFKGLDINVENERDYLIKYSSELLDFIRLKTPVRIVDDGQDILVDSDTLQWIYLS